MPENSGPEIHNPLKFDEFLARHPQEVIRLCQTFNLKKEKLQTLDYNAILRVALCYHISHISNFHEFQIAMWRGLSSIELPTAKFKKTLKVLHQQILEGFEREHPGLLSSINDSNFLEKIQDLSEQQIIFLWLHPGINQDKILDSINTVQQFKKLAGAIKKDYTLSGWATSDSYLFTKKVIDKGVLHRCIKTFNEFQYLVISNNYQYYFGFDKEGNQYRTTFIGQFQDRLSGLLQAQDSYGPDAIGLLCTLLSRLDENRCKQLVQENRAKVIGILTHLYPYKSNLELRAVRTILDYRESLDPSKFKGLIETLFPDLLPYDDYFIADIKALPTDLALFLLKKMPTEVLCRHLKDILKWSSFLDEKNKQLRNELLSHFFSRPLDGTVSTDQSRLFYSLFFQLSFETQTNFLETLAQKEKSDLRFQVYTVWHQQKSAAEKEQLLDCIEDSVWKTWILLLTTVPSETPIEDMEVLTRVFTKKTDILEIINLKNDRLQPSDRLGCFHPHYDYLCKIEEEIRAKIAQKDDFIQSLNDQCEYYSSREDFFKELAKKVASPFSLEARSLEEKAALYENLNTIFTRYRNVYAVSERDEQAKKECIDQIQKEVQDLPLTLKINIERSFIARVLTWLRDLAVFFNLCKPKPEDPNSIYRLENNRDLFFKQSKTKTVEDLQEALELTCKHFEKGS